MRRKRKTIVKIGRLLNLKRFICKKTQFVIDALFDWKPMTLTYKVNREGHDVSFIFFEFLDPKNIRNKTNFIVLACVLPELISLIRVGIKAVFLTS